MHRHVDLSFNPSLYVTKNYFSDNISIKIKYTIEKLVYISDACNDTGAKLFGKEGRFWMSAPLYLNNVYCQWKINVEDGKVRSKYYLTANVLPLRY